MTDNVNDIAGALQRQSEAWTAFKEANDANLTARDVLNDQKMDRINEVLSGLSDQMAALTRANTAPIVGERGSEVVNNDPALELRNYALYGIQSRAVTTTVGANADAKGAAGGYAVPEIFDRSIVQKSLDVSPLLGEVTVQRTSSPDQKIHANLRGTASSWVDEVGTNGMYGDTATPTLAEITVPFGNLFAKPLISQFALNDMYFDVEAFVSENVSLEFAQKVGASILTGTGIGQPKGILSHATAATADAARAFGTIEHVASGAAAALPTTADKYIDLVHRLKAAHRAKAKWVYSRATLAELRKLKDSTGQYLWQPSLQAGQPGTFLGYGIVEAEDMPVVAANALPILFGDLSEYRLYDLVGMTMLRDPYSYDAYIALKTMKRFGGTIANTEAFKVLKVATS